MFCRFWIYVFTRIEGYVGNTKKKFKAGFAKNELSSEDRKGLDRKVIGQENVKKVLCPSYHKIGRKTVEKFD